MSYCENRGYCRRWKKPADKLTPYSRIAAMRPKHRPTPLSSLRTIRRLSEKALLLLVNPFKRLCQRVAATHKKLVNYHGIAFVPRLFEFFARTPGQYFPPRLARPGLLPDEQTTRAQDVPV